MALDDINSIPQTEKQRRLEAAGAAYASITSEHVANDEEVSETIKTEVGPESAEGRAEIKEAGENNFLDQVYKYNSVTYEITYNYPLSDLDEAEPFKNLDALQRTLNGVEAKSESGEEIEQENIDEIQAAYDKTKVESAPHNDREKVDVFSSKELTEFKSSLEAVDKETTRLLGEFLAVHPVEADKPEEITIYIQQLDKLKEQIQQHQDKITTPTEGVLSEKQLEISYRDMQSFVRETEQALQQFEIAQDALSEATIPTQEVTEEIVNEVAQLQQLQAKIFSDVDTVKHLTHTERAAAHELLRQYKEADLEHKQKSANELEQFIELLGKNAPDPEREKMTAGNILADIEIDQGWNDNLVKTARWMHDEIVDIADNKPSEANPTDQLIAEKEWQQRFTQMLDNLHRLKVDHENDSLPSLAEDPSPFAQINVHERVGLKRRKKLSPQVLDAEEKTLPIFVNMSPQEQRNVAKPAPESVEVNSLEWLMRLHGAEVGRDIFDSKQVQKNFSELAKKTADTSIATEGDATETVEEVEKKPSLSELKPTLQKNQSPEEIVQIGLKKEIIAIEAKGIGRLDRWLDEIDLNEELEHSPYVIFGKKKFSGVEALSKLPKAKLEQLLDKDQINYQVFEQWSSRMAEIRQFVPDADRWTFKEVVDRYVKQLQSRYS